MSRPDPYGRPGWGLSPRDGTVTMIETILMTASAEKHRAARRPSRLGVVCVLLGVVLMLGGCTAALPRSARPTPSTPPPTTLVTIPPDGIGLRQLGITHGPAAFSVPLDSQFLTTADQAQSVTLVMAAPLPADVQAYLVSTLPAAGFTVTKKAKGAIVFHGYGWGGSFVITGSLSAVTLQDDKASGKTGRG